MGILVGVKTSHNHINNDKINDMMKNNANNMNCKKDNDSMTDMIKDRRNNLIIRVRCFITIMIFIIWRRAKPTPPPRQTPIASFAITGLCVF